MKKRILIAGLAMMLCLLCGCLEATPLTDEEMDVVAEYAATLLLKYDKNYDTPLYYVEEREERLTPTPTPEPTVKATPGPILETNNSASNNNPSQDPAKAPSATPTPAAMYNDAETSKQLTEIIAVENITITCEDYQIMDSVVSNDYFSLQAKEGRQYIVIYFKLHNNTDQVLTFDASGKGLEYSVDVNINAVSRVSLSMLENDLQYMPIEVPANGTADAVLVFETADTEINTLHLIIEDKDENVVFVKMQ